MFALMLIFRLLSPVVAIISLLPTSVFFVLLVAGLISAVFYGKFLLAIGVVVASVLFKLLLIKQFLNRI